MVTRRHATRALAGALAMLLAGCAANPAGYQPSAVEQRLTGRVFVGEWKPGFSYRITFKGVGVEMAAVVQVIDSDPARTVYTMPATVRVDGDKVALQFTNLDRVDRLVYAATDDRLAGQSFFRGALRNEVWAKGS